MSISNYDKWNSLDRLSTGSLMLVRLVRDTDICGMPFKQGQVLVYDAASKTVLTYVEWDNIDRHELEFVAYLMQGAPTIQIYDDEDKHDAKSNRIKKQPKSDTIIKRSSRSKKKPQDNSDRAFNAENAAERSRFKLGSNSTVAKAVRKSGLWDPRG